MVKFLLRRLVNYILLIVIASSLAYLLAAASLHPRARFESRNPPPPPAVVDATLNELNMNDKTPILKRYVTWVDRVVHGDFGKTIDGDSVNAEMGRRIGVSLRLLLIGTVLGSGIGVLLGAWGAVRQYKLSDRIVTFLSFFLLATPVFLTGVLLKVGALGVNHAAGTTVLSFVGEFTPGASGGFWEQALDRIRHLILPSLTVILLQLALFSRYQRNSLLDVLNSDFLRTAQAKGLRRGRAILKHGLRTALIPTATFFAYSFGLLLTGAVFTEKLFAWHGMGEWFVDSVGTSDVNAVAAVNVFASVLVLVAGMLADLMLAALDPRVRVR